jgi:hypothetical protein
VVRAAVLAPAAFAQEPLDLDGSVPLQFLELKIVGDDEGALLSSERGGDAIGVRELMPRPYATRFHHQRKSNIDEGQRQIKHAPQQEQYH